MSSIVLEEEFDENYEPTQEGTKSYSRHRVLNHDLC